MTVKAEVLADSVGDNGVRVTTFLLEMPRWILAELNTHRSFSRNAASSRAIPIDKMIEKVQNDPAMPVFWGKNQKGMQAREEMSAEEQQEAIARWLAARDSAVKAAKDLAATGCHKQIVNRLIENFMNVKVVCTSTEYNNFFALRDHEDAQPEIRVLASLMKKEMASSSPILRGTDLSSQDSWHLPLVTDHERASANLATNILRSVARCARTSYDRVEGGTSDIANDIRIFRQLTSSVPIHASPLEHQAAPSPRQLMQSFYNLYSWTSLRWLSDRRFHDLIPDNLIAAASISES